MRARAESLAAKHEESHRKVAAARERLVQAAEEMRQVADDYNAEVADLLTEARPAFSYRDPRPAVVEQGPVRNELTDQVHYQPKVRKPAQPDAMRPLVEAQVMHAAWAGVHNNTVDRGHVRALTVDGTTLEPVIVGEGTLSAVASTLGLADALRGRR